MRFGTRRPPPPVDSSRSALRCGSCVMGVIPPLQTLQEGQTYFVMFMTMYKKDAQSNGMVGLCRRNRQDRHELVVHRNSNDGRRCACCRMVAEAERGGCVISAFRLWYFSPPMQRRKLNHAILNVQPCKLRSRTMQVAKPNHASSRAKPCTFACAWFSFYASIH